jgi:hypothetical protein
VLEYLPEEEVRVAIKLWVLLYDEVYGGGKIEFQHGRQKARQSPQPQR